VVGVLASKQHWLTCQLIKAGRYRIEVYFTFSHSRKSRLWLWSNRPSRVGDEWRRPCTTRKRPCFCRGLFLLRTVSPPPLRDSVVECGRARVQSIRCWRAGRGRRCICGPQQKNPTTSTSPSGVMPAAAKAGHKNRRIVVPSWLVAGPRGCWGLSGTLSFPSWTGRSRDTAC
jgi:hypothetical protein